MQLKYTKEHEWIKIDGNIASIGITVHAAEALGTLVFVELPNVGTKLNIGDACGVVESAKSASDVYSPVSGEIVEVNNHLESQPDAINEAKDGEVWICKVKVSNITELNDYMSKNEYDAFLQH
jgi:glycine cleavage system H protein